MDTADRPPHDEVVFVGRSNVGKSTIMRQLTGSGRFQTGRRPGVTRAPAHYTHPQHNFMFTDLPGFGFLSGVASDRQDAILTELVGYLEDNADAILAAVLVLDGNAAVEIIDRHADRGEIPHTIELYEFLTGLGVFVVLAVNKCDKLQDRDADLEAIADRFGLPRRGSSGATSSHRLPLHPVISPRSVRPWMTASSRSDVIRSVSSCSRLHPPVCQTTRRSHRSDSGRPHHR